MRIIAVRIYKRTYVRTYVLRMYICIRVVEHINTRQVVDDTRIIYHIYRYLVDFRVFEF